MSLLERKAIVNYKVSYVRATGEYGCYNSTKMMECYIWGKVTERIVYQWQYDLAKEEETSLNKDGDGTVSSLSVTVTGFTKLDV